LVTFVFERSQTASGEHAFEFKEFHPIKGFVGLAQTVTELGDVLGVRARSLSFPIVRPN